MLKKRTSIQPTIVKLQHRPDFRFVTQDSLKALSKRAAFEEFMYPVLEHEPAVLWLRVFAVNNVLDELAAL